MEFMKKVTVRTITLKDELTYQGTPMLKYTIEYPEFSARAYQAAVKKINAYYKKTARSYQTYVRTALLKSAIATYQNSVKNGYPFHGYEAMLTYVLTYNQRCTVSLYMDQYEYIGGAHGNTVRTSQTWSINDGQRIPLKALFPHNSPYIVELKREINRQIAQQIKDGTGAYFENYQELVNKTFDPNNFYLTPKALVIYFQQYDIAPYASGIPTFQIPYQKVGAKLPYCKG